MRRRASRFDRLVAIGVGKIDGDRRIRLVQARRNDVCASFASRPKSTVLLDVEGVEVTGEDAANFAAGILLRAYSFDKYKTQEGQWGRQAGRKAGQGSPSSVPTPAAAKKAFAVAQSVVDGVVLARDLVNEPANMLGPVEFAAHAKDLESLGVKVEILTEREMRKLGMGALLGVAQGSARPPRLVVMSWQGGKPKEKPIAFIGKGVVFDTGGNSIKPAAGMEDMKGDMGGAAAVVGLMHALAARKAKANVVGIIGCVENSVDGKRSGPATS